MNEKQREHFKNILKAWRLELMEEVDRTVSHMKDEAANFPDPADRATQEEEFSLELRTRDRERKLIKKLIRLLFELKKMIMAFVINVVSKLVSEDSRLDPPLICVLTARL